MKRCKISEQRSTEKKKAWKRKARTQARKKKLEEGEGDETGLTSNERDKVLSSVSAHHEEEPLRMFLPRPSGNTPPTTESLLRKAEVRTALNRVEGGGALHLLRGRAPAISVTPLKDSHPLHAKQEVQKLSFTSLVFLLFLCLILYTIYGARCDVHKGTITPKKKKPPLAVCMHTSSRKTKKKKKTPCFQSWTQCSVIVKRDIERCKALFFFSS